MDGVGRGFGALFGPTKSIVLGRICSPGIRQRNSRLSGRSALGRCVVVGAYHLVTILSGRTSSLHKVFVGVNYAAAFETAALFSS